MERIAIPNPKLEVRDLRLLLALAEAGSTARAARLLHLTQPAISRALLAMEDKLGAPLFRRSAQGLVLTELGQRLLPAAGQALVTMQELDTLVRAPQPGVQQLRLVCECYTAYHWLPSTLAALRTSMPDVQLSLAIEHTADPVSGLQEGMVDAALVTQAHVPSSEFVCRPLFADEVVFVMAPSHPLARQKTLSADDLTRTKLLLSSHTPTDEVSWFMKQVFGRSRPRLDVERIPLTDAIFELVRSGLGVTAVSEWVVAPHLHKGDLIVRRLNRGALERPWRIVYRRELGDAGARLRSALTALAPHGSPPPEASRGGRR